MSLPGAVFNVYGHPSCSGKEHKAWGPEEKLYLGNRNDFSLLLSTGLAACGRLPFERNRNGVSSIQASDVPLSIMLVARYHTVMGHSPDP